MIGRLVYLYVGTDDVTRAVDFYHECLGAELVWRFDAFATDVAAMRLAPDSPLVLLAEHRPAPGVLPIWTVPSLDAAVARLAGSSFAATGETVGTPDGPVHVVRDPSGNELGLLQQDRPNALDAAFADPDNTNAVRGPGDGTDRAAPPPGPTAAKPPEKGRAPRLLDSSRLRADTEP